MKVQCINCDSVILKPHLMCMECQNNNEEGYTGLISILELDIIGLTPCSIMKEGVENCVQRMAEADDLSTLEIQYLESAIRCALKTVDEVWINLLHLQNASVDNVRSESLSNITEGV